jgi:hypothetical protein
MNGFASSHANDDAEFSIANLPFGIASSHDGSRRQQAATRLREHVYFLPELIAQGVLSGLDAATIDALHQVRAAMAKLLALTVIASVESACCSWPSIASLSPAGAAGSAVWLRRIEVVPHP